MSTTFLKFRSVSANRIILICALWLTLFTNLTYFQKVLEVYELNAANSGFLLAIVLLQFSLIGLLLSLFGVKYLIKTLLIIVLLSAASSAYFMQTFGVVIDEDMIRNTLQTNPAEASDLLTINFVATVALLGVLPALWVLLTPIHWKSPGKETLSRIKLIVLMMLLTVACLGLFYKPFASFFREHKPIRFYSNPLYMMYSSVKYISGDLIDQSKIVNALGLDAHIPVDDTERELIIFVVGETARADHFSLNGYARKTNPLLEKEDVLNMPRMSSCGTSTAVSVPCMFSVLAQDQFSNKDAAQTENALDVLKHAGVNILWRDNNSSSKGVADRVEYQSFQDPSVNPICDSECRDIGMLSGLDDYIRNHPKVDILIVLHQMGNHGPAYYKRYPPEFETFVPSCKTAQLEDCTQQEISNAYDNAIVYTDYFLSETIQFLKSYSSQFETALLYASDHGESLGESGIYLHGLPLFIAPDTQTHVAAFLWLGEHYDDIDRTAFQRIATGPLTHDNLFHTLLGLFEVESEVHDAEKDLLTSAH